MPKKDPHSANVTWWGADSERQDYTGTTGNCILEMFKSLSSVAQLNMLKTLEKEQSINAARKNK